MHLFSVRRSALFTGILAASTVTSSGRIDAQLVTPKTIPVRQAQQFDLYPTSLPGFGAAGLTVDDTLFDAFVNPAKAARFSSSGLFGAPYAHAITGPGGGGKTMPLGGFGTVGRWAFTGIVAVQELERVGRNFAEVSERTATNHYGSLSVARRLGSTLAVGASAYHATLGAVDGVDALYSGSDHIYQDGSLTDVRLGATKRWTGDRVAELLLVHNRTDMTQDVDWTESAWVGTGAQRHQVVTPRSEHNADRTNIWGAHSQYSQAVGTDGWRIGGLATLNRIDHPKIPNYRTFSNIPRDPGTTWGGNIGAGASHAVGQSLFALSYVYEPMSSKTWGVAAQDTTGPGGTVHTGERTIDNDFYFTNSKIAIGIGHRATLPDSGTSFGYHAGLQAYSIDYRLIQQNHVSGEERLQREHWRDWTTSVGFEWRSRNLTFSYAFAMTCGGGSPCIEFAMGDKVEVTSAPANGGIITAPTRALNMNPGNEYSHRFGIVVPIR